MHKINEDEDIYVERAHDPQADAKTLRMGTESVPKLLLEFAFVNEVIDQMKLEPLRERLHYLVEKRFRGELNKCEGCKLCK